MSRKDRQLMIIGKERPFDEERWKQLLTAFAYVLHEQRREELNALLEPPATEHDTETMRARSDETGGR